MQNRRLNPRVNVNWSAEIKVPGKEQAIPARVKDISLKGTYLEADFEMHTGQQFLLKMHARIGERLIPVITQAAVVRRMLLSQMRGYGYGVALIRVRSQDGPVLQRILGEAGETAIAADADPSREDDNVWELNALQQVSRS